MRFIKRFIFKRFKKWVPFDPSKSCKVKVGDFIKIRKETKTFDYIAGSLGMNGDCESGLEIIWDVKKVYQNDLLLESGGNRICLRHHEWTDNVMHVDKGFLRDACDYSFFMIEE